MMNYNAEFNSTNQEEAQQNANEISFADIKQIIDQANTAKHGFESLLLEFILARFNEFGEDNNCNCLPLFQKMFREFKVKDYFESENRIDLNFTCFEYVDLAHDLFLPKYTAETFVKQCTTDFFADKGKHINLSLNFLVN